MASTRLTTEEAQKHIRALSTRITELNKELIAMRKNTSISASEMTEKYNRIKYSIAAADKQLSSYKKELDDINRAEIRSAKSIKKTTKWVKEQGKEFSKSSKEANKFNKRVKGSKEGVSGLFTSVRSLLSAFGIIAGLQMFGNIIRNTGKLALKLDSLKYALQSITDDTWEYAQSQQFLMELNRKFGADLVTTGERWVNFRAAAKQSNLTLLESEKIFRSMTKVAAVLGKNTDDLRSIYLALEQMLSKGKITTEELRRQLGEKIPGAMGIMAAAIGVTIPKLDEMLKKGEVLSAEVMPDFADAVEVAFGVESVDKVDTWRASLDRVKGSWQLLVSEVAEGDSVVSKVFTHLTKTLNGAINELRVLLASDDQKMNIDVELATDKVKNTIREQAVSNIEAVEEERDVIKKLRNQILKNNADYENTLDKEKRIALKKRNEELLREIVLYNKKVLEEEKKVAAVGFHELEDRLKKEKEAYEKNKEEIAKFDKEEIGILEATKLTLKETFGLSDEKVNQKNALIQEKNLRYENLVALQAEYDAKRKLLEVLPPTKVTDDGPGGSSRLRQLEDIRDLEKDVQKAIAETILQGQEQALQNEEMGLNDRLALLKKYQNTKNRISELGFQIEIDKIKAAEKKKLEALSKPASNNEILPSEEELASQRLAIQKEADDKIKIAYQKHQADMVSIGAETSKKISAATEESTNNSLEILQTAYNEEIATIKERYRLSKQTNKDRQQMNYELSRVAVEAANAQIDAEIKILEAKLAVKDLDKEIIALYRARIAELQASRPTFDPPEDQEKWKEYFTSILDYAGEFNAALGSLVDNLYARRIENINAEIEAERDKYDRLIELAKNDEQQKKTLERNKELRMKQLEKRRLAEEQKQAKARKAFALADIAINTAAAIMGIWAQVPKFDFGVSAAAMTAFVGALGAVQMASVLAQPIPKYKDGGTIKKDEKGIINDGAFKEYVERDGEIFTTDRKNAMVDLKKDDIVYRNYGELAKKSRSYKGLLGGESVSEKDFNKLFSGVTSSIDKGFKKAKINNQVTVINKTNNDSYADKMSRWNG